MKSWANFSTDISFVHGAKWTIFERQSTNMAMAVFPSDYGKSVTRSVVICCHFRSGSGIGCSTPAFFLWFDFTNWQTGQDRMYSPTVLHIPCHQKALLMWSTILLSPMWPIAGTSWSSGMIFCCRTLGTTINHRSPSTRYKILWGDILSFFLCNCSSLWLNTSRSSSSVFWASSTCFNSSVDSWALDAWTVIMPAGSSLAPLWVEWSISSFSVRWGLLLLNASVTIFALPRWYLNLGLIECSNPSRTHHNCIQDKTCYSIRWVKGWWSLTTVTPPGQLSK